MTPVIVCTAQRGVIFGYAEEFRPNERGQITLESARMCLYWPAEVGGVFGLGVTGPDVNTKVSATLSKVLLEGVSAIFDVSSEAEKAWTSAPVQGHK